MLRSHLSKRPWPERILTLILSAGRWVAATVLVVMPVLAFTHGHELKQTVKAAWSRWDTRRATALLENELTASTGVKLLIQALVRSPDEPVVIRSLAQTTDRAGMPLHARFFYEHLARRNALTQDDKLRRAAVLARLHDQTGAQAALRKFVEIEGESPALWRTQAEIAAGSGDLASARAALCKVLAQVPQDRAAVLDLAKSQAFSADSAQQHAGVEQLLDVFEQSLHDFDSTRRTQCFWTLSGMTMLDPEQRDRFAGLIGQMPWKKLECLVMKRLLEWSVDRADHSDDRLRWWLRDMCIREIDTGADERLAVAKMLQRHGLHLSVLEWIPFDLGLRDAAHCTARLDSLIAVKSWVEASAMIEHKACPLPSELRAIMRAHLQLQVSGGKALKSEQLLRAALTAAKKSDNQGGLVAIGRLASEFDHREIALACHVEAMGSRFPCALFIADAFIQEARQSGGSADIVLSKLSRRRADEPWNQDLVRKLRYYRVLCGDGIEVVEVEALQTLREQPQDVYSAFLVAFARLRLAQTAQIKPCLSLLSRPHSWSEGQRAVLHAIFHAVGELETAESFRDSLSGNAALFVEEQRLIADAMLPVAGIKNDHKAGFADSKSEIQPEFTVRKALHGHMPWSAAERTGAALFAR